MSHHLLFTGSSFRAASRAGLRGLRPVMAAALGLLSITGATAQNRAFPLSVAAEKVARPVSAAPAAVLPVRTARAVAQRGQAAISSTATGGNWSDATTWVGGVVPTSTDDVTVASGATVTLDVAGSCASLTVEATASLLTSATTAYKLEVAGNVTNNGTLDLSNSSTLGSDLRFTGAGNATFTGTGTTDLQSITLAKAVRADIVDMNLPTLSVKGTAGGNDGFLLTRTTASPAADDMTGTLKISGTATISNRVFGNAAAYVIPATGGFWLNNANFTVTSQTGSPSVAGLLRISAGTYNVGVTIGNSITFAASSVFTMEGGTLTSAGRVTSYTSATTSAAVTATITGGTINASNVGNTSAAPSFGFSGVVTISGGTINLVQRSTATAPLDYNVGLATGSSITGGTLNVGTAATATNFDFRIRGSVPNLVVDNTTNNKSVLLAAQTNGFGTVLITPGASLNLNGFLLLQVGPSITNNGTLTGTTTNSTLYFQGNAPQTVGGTGTFTTIRTITVDNNGGGVTLNAPITTTRVNMFTGNLNGTSNLTVGDGSAIFFVVQIGVTSNTGSSGSFASAPTFNIGNGAIQLIYGPETTNRTTGFEVPATRLVDVVSISNPAGVTLAGGNLLVPGVSNASLLLTAGILTTSATNKVIIGPDAGAFPTGLATSYVNGPLGIAVNSATAVSRTFAVGDAAGWRPVVVSGITTTADQIFTATVVNGATGGTGVSPVTNLNPTRYVRLENSASLPATARVQLSYGTDDVLGNAATATVAQAATANGAYASIGGAAATVPATGIISTLDLTPGNDFFVLANTEGGVLSTSVAGVCGGTNAGTLTLAGNIGTITGYEANTGSGFVAVPGTNTGSTLAFSNLTTTTTFRAVILTADNRTVYSNAVTVNVEAAPTATLTAATPTTFCGPGTLTLNATPVTGATYQFLLDGAPINGATSATYTTTVSANGSYSVVVTSATGCTTTSAAVAVTVNPATTATFSYANTTLCAGGSAVTPTITGTTGGTFSSTTGLSIDASTGAISPATSTPGTYTVTYSVAGTCPSSATATVTITTAPVATFSYAAATYCASGTTPAAPVFATGASAGTFSSTAGLSINATTGVVTPGTSTPGTYTVTNTIAAAGSCAAATATATVTISAATTATFSYAAATACAGGSALLPTITGTTGGTFSSTTGLTINSSTGSIDLTASTAGTYVVTYSVAGTCPSSATFSVTINARPAQPTVSPVYNGATTTLSSSSATGNQWYLNGVAIAGATSQTYVVNSAAQFGAYTVVVTNATTTCASLPSTPLIVSSSLKQLAGSSLNVYPNPTTDGNVTVELSGYANATELTVYNAVGQLVLSTSAAGRTGVQKATLDMRQLPAGVYLLRARTEGGLDVRRITKQ